MINLLIETDHAIHLANKSIDDVKYIISASKEFKTTWPIFKHFAENMNYNNKIPLNVVADLTVVFHDGSALEREVTDYEEYWIYNNYQTNPYDLELNSQSQLKEDLPI